MAEAKRLKTPNRVKQKARYLKMKVINDLKPVQLQRMSRACRKHSGLTTIDPSYTKLKEHVHSHTASVVPHEELPNVLHGYTPRSAMPNDSSGRVLQGKAQYLQYYLNQFCYKFNRRYFGENQFDRLLIAAISCAPDFKSEFTIGTIADNHFLFWFQILYLPVKPAADSAFGWTNCSNEYPVVSIMEASMASKMVVAEAGRCHDIQPVTLLLDFHGDNDL